jgi:hypothetical protein
MISAGVGQSIGITSDGDTVAAGDNYNGQISISGWKNIESVSAGCGYTVGVDSNGTMLIAGTAPGISGVIENKKAFIEE